MRSYFEDGANCGHVYLQQSKILGLKARLENKKKSGFEFYSAIDLKFRQGSVGNKTKNWNNCFE